MAPTPAAPTLSPTRHATEGMDSGAVEVPQTTRSMVSPSMPACSTALRAAPIARVAQVSSSPRKRRSWMPVRVEIQSSVVSRTLSRSLLVTTRLPTARPAPTILPTGPPFIRAPPTRGARRRARAPGPCRSRPAPPPPGRPRRSCPRARRSYGLPGGAGRVEGLRERADKTLSRARDLDERVRDAARPGVAVPDHDRTPNAQQKRTPVVLRVHLIPDADQPGLQCPAGGPADQLPR